MKKKARVVSILITLCVCVATDTNAQQLWIGDKVPDVYLPELYNYEKTSANLISEFGGKPTIIDFWFTRCKSCIEDMPKIDSLKKNYKGRVNFVLSTFESREKVEKFWTGNRYTRNLKIPTVLKDSLSLRSKLFAMHTNPHVVWINAQGVVEAITDGYWVKPEYIDVFLAGGKLNLPMKLEAADRATFLGKIPLIETATRFNEGKNIHENTFIGGYIPMVKLNLRLDYQDETTGLYHFTYANVPLRSIYLAVFGQTSIKQNQFIVDSSLLNLFKHDFLNFKNLVSYDFITTDTSKTRRLQRVKGDMDNFFGITSTIEKRWIDCYILRKRQDGKKYRSLTKPRIEEEPKGINSKKGMIWSHIVGLLFDRYEPYTMLDETGIDPMQRIHIWFPTNFSDIHHVNRVLGEYGLEVSIEKRERNVIIINPARSKISFSRIP